MNSDTAYKKTTINKEAENHLALKPQIPYRWGKDRTTEETHFKDTGSQG